MSKLPFTLALPNNLNPINSTSQGFLAPGLSFRPYEPSEMKCPSAHLAASHQSEPEASSSSPSSDNAVSGTDEDDGTASTSTGSPLSSLPTTPNSSEDEGEEGESKSASTSKSQPKQPAKVARKRMSYAEFRPLALNHTVAELSTKLGITKKAVRAKMYYMSASIAKKDGRSAQDVHEELHAAREANGIPRSIQARRQPGFAKASKTKLAKTAKMVEKTDEVEEDDNMTDGPASPDSQTTIFLDADTQPIDELEQIRRAAAAEGLLMLRRGAMTPADAAAARALVQLSREDAPLGAGRANNADDVEMEL